MYLSLDCVLGRVRGAAPAAAGRVVVFWILFWRGFWIIYPEESASCKAVINDKQPWHVIDFRLNEIGPIIK